jgi:hypothetical protein
LHELEEAPFVAVGFFALAFTVGVAFFDAVRVSVGRIYLRVTDVEVGFTVLRIKGLRVAVAVMVGGTSVLVGIGVLVERSTWSSRLAVVGVGSFGSPPEVM